MIQKERSRDPKTDPEIQIWRSREAKIIALQVFLFSFSQNLVLEELVDVQIVNGRNELSSTAAKDPIKLKGEIESSFFPALVIRSDSCNSSFILL